MHSLETAVTRDLEPQTLGAHVETEPAPPAGQPPLQDTVDSEIRADVESSGISHIQVTRPRAGQLSPVSELPWVRLCMSTGDPTYQLQERISTGTVH